MNNHESIHAVGQSQTEPRTRARAKAKITVQSSETKPYDRTASPALMEIRISETFTGDIDGESPVRALQVLCDDHSASLVNMQRFAEDWVDGRAHLCFKVQKSLMKAGSSRPGLSFPDREQAIFPGCAARAGLKANLKKGPTDGWIIGSNDVAIVRSSVARWKRKHDHHDV